MDYDTSQKKNETAGEFEIDPMIFLKKFLKNWWIIAIFAVSFALCGFVVARVNYVPKYSSKIMFIANNKNPDIPVFGQTSSDLSASAQLAESLKYVFKTVELSKIVAEHSGYKDVSVEDIQRWVSVSAIEDTSIVNLTVTTMQPDLSYGIAKAYVQNYGKAVENAFPSTTLTVVDPPLLPSGPNVDNSAMKYALLGFLGGGILAVGLIVLVVLAKNSIKSVDDIRDKLGLKVLGVVRWEEGKKKKQQKPVLISDSKSGFFFIENFKIIRTKIEYMAEKNGYKTIMVTSTMEKEGKTTNSVNLALALAKNGKSVLLIDGDLRKPAIARTLNINAGGDRGLADLLSGKKTLAESIKYSEKYNLFLLLCGEPIPDPSELLSVQGMSGIIEAAEKEFDYVIIDTAPCGLVADASVLAAYADASILVIRHDGVSVRRIKRAIENIENSGTRIVGCIYSSADGEDSRYLLKRRRGGRYGYNYGYGSYGYGYGYRGRSPERKKTGTQTGTQ